MDWQQAGAAWGSRAVDWAYLMEPYARPANDILFDELGATRGTADPPARALSQGRPAAGRDASAHVEHHAFQF